MTGSLEVPLGTVCGLGFNGPLGGLAQLARASALQAGGQGFESLALHIARHHGWARFFDRMEGKTINQSPGAARAVPAQRKKQFTW